MFLPDLAAVQGALKLSSKHFTLLEYDLPPLVLFSGRGYHPNPERSRIQDAVFVEAASSRPRI